MKSTFPVKSQLNMGRKSTLSVWIGAMCRWRVHYYKGLNYYYQYFEIGCMQLCSYAIIFCPVYCLCLFSY